MKHGLKTGLQDKLAETLKVPSQRIETFSKGRVGLYTILKAMGLGPGDEVVIPAYTCVVVPNAIKYLGAIPRYVDISLSSFSMEPENVSGHMNAKVRAVICQNTYGLSHGVDELTALCKKRGIYSIEDCTHGYGGTFHGRPNGTWSDAAFYSSQWNKPFSSGIGGYSYVGHEDLAKRVAQLTEELEDPTWKDEISLGVLLLARGLVTGPVYYLLVNLYRFLSARNLVTGSSSGEELSGVDMPAGYLKKMSNVQMRAALRSLKRLPNIQERRTRNGLAYTEALQRLGRNHVSPGLHVDHLFLKYPLLVRDRKEFVEQARKAGIPLGDWFTSPLHPIEGDLDKWGFDPALYPNAVFAATHVVNLPTDTVNPQRVISFLNDNQENIYVPLEGNQVHV